MAGKGYLVTGCSSGIGAAVTHALLESGAEVTGLSRTQPEPGDPGSMRFGHICCDLSNSTDLDRKISDLLRETGGLDGAVLCHGYGDFGSLEEFSVSRIRSMLETNLTSMILIARILVPALKRQGSGDLILIGSESALAGGKRGAVYSAAKFGLRGFVQSLRQECAASGVRVSIVNPGMVRTAFFDPLDFAPGDSRDNYIEPEDVAETVVSMLVMPQGSVVDEVNMSPQKKVIRNKEPG